MVRISIPSSYILLLLQMTSSLLTIRVYHLQLLASRRETSSSKHADCSVRMKRVFWGFTKITAALAVTPYLTSRATGTYRRRLISWMMPSHRHPRSRTSTSKRSISEIHTSSRITHHNLATTFLCSRSRVTNQHSWGMNQRRVSLHPACWRLQYLDANTFSLIQTLLAGILFIMTGIHAREFTPPELAMRWIEGLIDGYQSNVDMRAALNHVEVHVVLQTNPDGRYAAETNQNIKWRKNVNPTEGPSCEVTVWGNGPGVDLNRNFDFFWGYDDLGSSPNACSSTFRGSAAGE